MSSVTVVMPAHNEAGGIAEFLTEVQAALGDALAGFIVVDDVSSDGTRDVLATLAEDGLPITVVPNETNLGHGPSTLRALRAGLERGTTVVAVDGDGQFVGEDIADLVRIHDACDYDVVEGVRTERGDPLFRRLTSAATRALVARDCGERVNDANTPLRVYRPEVLRKLLDQLPQEAMTPNLMIASLTRRDGFRYKAIPVRSIPRRGATQLGSTWGQKRKALPTKRFIRFCADATNEWRAFRAGSTR